jgi:hypothetical protein
MLCSLGGATVERLFVATSKDTGGFPDADDVNYTDVVN